MIAGDLFENAINQWNKAVGVGTAIIPPPLDDKQMILAILQRLYNKRPDSLTLIVVPDFDVRGTIIEYLTHQDDKDNNEEFKKLIEDKKIKVLTHSFLNSIKSPVHVLLTVCYRLETITDAVEYHLLHSKYKLVVSDRLFHNNDDNVKVNKICPTLDAFKQAEIDQLRTTRPVEEILVGVDISKYETDVKLLKFYDDEIAKTISIFGSFDIIQQARTGNKTLNISAQQICNDIAKENGWNEHLDMSIDYNRQIDALYNPSNLRDRASTVYDIIRNRNSLVSSHTAKLEKILEIVNEHPNEKILVISKTGEFARLITEYLNNNSESPICGDYHDKVDLVPATDIDGNPIVYKTGHKKGQRKMIAAQAQRTYNEQLFNLNRLRVLSASNSPDKDLQITLDRIIISSPLCEEVETYLYRLSKISFNTGKICVVTLYCRDTLEEQRANDKEPTSTHEIIKDVKNISVDEKYSDFIIAD